MASAQYSVVPDDGSNPGAWNINHDGNDYGPFDSQAAAVRSAIDTAHAAGEAGFAGRVVVQGRDTLFRGVWTHGEDPYPPVDDAD